MDYKVPYKKLEYTSSKTAKEILDKLAQDVDSSKKFRWTYNHSHPFSGSLEEDSFKIWRNLTYRNSFNPVVEGNIKELPGGTSQIEIRIQLHRFVQVFMIFWLSGTLLFPPMAIFGYFLVRWGFKREAEKTIQYFDALFQEMQRSSEKGLTQEELEWDNRFAPPESPTEEKPEDPFSRF
ncbi:MAG: hypothetical protein AAF518_01710 [Spirochaetota bacterium]